MNMKEVLSHLGTTQTDQTLISLLVMLLFAAFSVITFFVLDFKRNIDKTLDKHSNKIGAHNSEFTRKIDEVRLSITQHSEDIDRQTKEVNGSFLRLREDAVKIKEEIKDQLNEALREFLKLKICLEKLESKMEENQNKNQEKYGKVLHLKKNIASNVIQINEAKKEIKKSNSDIIKISEVVDSNRQSLIISKNIFKRYSEEIKALKKKVK